MRRRRRWVRRGVRLTQTITTTRVGDGALSQALSLWLKLLAVHDPAKVIPSWPPGTPVPFRPATSILDRGAPHPRRDPSSPSNPVRESESDGREVPVTRPAQPAREKIRASRSILDHPLTDDLICWTLIHLYLGDS